MNTISPVSSPPLTPSQGFSLGWSRYAEFRGRSSRMEFWAFNIISFFIMCLLSLLFIVPGLIFYLAWLIPSISTSVRRLHDIGRSGMWIFWAYASYLTLPLAAFGEEFGLVSSNDAVAGLLTLSIMFIGVMNLIPCLMWFMEGDPGTNKYGPNPKLNPTNPNNPN